MILSIFSNCKIVGGIKRSLIIDLQRSIYFIVPKDLVRFIELVKGVNLAEFCENIEDETDKRVINEYVDFILTNDIGLLHEYAISSNLIDFPDQFDSSYLITNMSIEINSNSEKVLNEVGRTLEGKKTQCIELLCFKDFVYPLQLFKYIDALSPIVYDELRIILKYTNEYSLDYIKKICMGNIQIFSILLHSAENEFKEVLEDGMTTISYQTQSINSCLNCGMVAEKYFTSNKEFYTEGLSRNTCLNRKIGIDAAGNLKNCLSQQKCFGNILEVDLIETLESNEFQRLWNITKNNVKKCQVCEFRMICPDCRIFIEDPNDILSAPLKCGYDPYTGIWNDWEKEFEKADIFKGYKLKAEMF